jgi:hypothetical protein
MICFLLLNLAVILSCFPSHLLMVDSEGEVNVWDSLMDGTR